MSHYKFQIEKAIQRQNKIDSKIHWSYSFKDKGHSVFIKIKGKKGDIEITDSISLSKRNGYMATFFRVNSKIDIIRKKIVNKNTDNSFLDNDSLRSNP